jgi:hypothetical protein
MVLLKDLADVDEGEEVDEEEGDDSPEPADPENDPVAALDSMEIKLAGETT